MLAKIEQSVNPTILDILPRDRQLMVMSYLDAQTLIHKISLVCKAWKEISTDDQLWQYHLEKKFPDSYVNSQQIRQIGVSSILSHFELYKKCTLFWKKIVTDLSCEKIPCYGTHEAPKSLTTPLVFSSDRFAGGMSDGIIKSWSLSTPRIEKTFTHVHKLGISHLITHEDKWISSSHDSSIAIYDHEGKWLKTLKGHANEICDLQVYEKKLYSGARQDPRIKIWEIDNEETNPVSQIEISCTPPIDIFCFKIGQNILAVGNVDGRMFLNFEKERYAVQLSTSSICQIDIEDNSVYSNGSGIKAFNLKQKKITMNQEGEKFKLTSDLIICYYLTNTMIDVLERSAGNAIILMDDPIQEERIIDLEVFDKKILSVSADNKMRIWDSDKTAPIKTHQLCHSFKKGAFPTSIKVIDNKVFVGMHEKIKIYS